ncbi:MAG TPA: hypothetical protein VNC50_04750 [Planctomycetia bacterium]|nr:hypothetical protein [Planctomycetia bacterium]
MSMQVAVPDPGEIIMAPVLECSRIEAFRHTVTPTRWRYTVTAAFVDPLIATCFDELRLFETIGAEPAPGPTPPVTAGPPVVTISVGAVLIRYLSAGPGVALPALTGTIIFESDVQAGGIDVHHAGDVCQVVVQIPTSEPGRPRPRAASSAAPAAAAAAAGGPNMIRFPHMDCAKCSYVKAPAGPDWNYTVTARYDDPVVAPQFDRLLLVPRARNLNAPNPPTLPKIFLLPILVRNGSAPGGSPAAHQMDYVISSPHTAPPTKIFLGRRKADCEVKPPMP